MATPKKRSVRKGKKLDVKNTDYVKLVDIVRTSKDDKKVELAFNEIELRMRPRMRQISYKFHIPGSGKDDIYQESLFALRFKAIKDYDQSRGNDSGPYPFDKFAVLCIRRHLSTKLKASYQNKKVVLNRAISLDQDRNQDSNDHLFLADIVPKTVGTVLSEIESSEYYRTLFSQLFKKLSGFEQSVFKLYMQKHSYEQIAQKINNEPDRKKSNAINVKSVDNALSRIKSKAQAVFNKYGETDEEDSE